MRRPETDELSAAACAEESPRNGGAFLVGISEGGPDGDAEAGCGLDELQELVRTLGLPVEGCMTAVRRGSPDPRTFVGSGKALEIAKEAERLHAQTVIFDTELGPSQQRNLEKICRVKVLDRQEVILDIFASRARTKEAVLQVELARNTYFLPRLTRAWSHLSRQHGGAMGTRGEGEKQIEYDRRHVRMQIAKLKEELAVVRKQRDVQRKNRVRGDYPMAAIVGYTNAGKSSLLNLLTGADAFVEDELFATLDPTTRKLSLPENGNLLLTDTVGFVRKLPHTLVEAFKSTLEEALLADFLVLVSDVSSPEVEAHRETTLSVLAELGAQDKPILSVFNKCDRENDPLVLSRLRSVVRDGVFISCKTGEGIDELKQRLGEFASMRSKIDELSIPPERADIVAKIHAKTSLLEGKYEDDGTFRCVVRIPAKERNFFLPFMNRTETNI